MRASGGEGEESRESVCVAMLPSASTHRPVRRGDASHLSRRDVREDTQPAVEKDAAQAGDAVREAAAVATEIVNSRIMDM